MIETIVKLNTTTEVAEFSNLVSKCKDEVLAYGGRYIVNAKSLMGLYSLNLSEPVKIEFYGDIPECVKKGVKKYIV